jgi:hypothetical protein
MTQKPTRINMFKNRLHNQYGPAVEYADGFKLYSMNGVRFSTELAEKFILPKDLDAKKVLSIKNVEQRAEVIKKFGIGKLFYQLKPQKLDSQNNYELYSISLYQGVPRIYLKMDNPSIEEVHIEAVDPECRTVEQALQWRNFGTIEIPKAGFTQPLILT